MRRRPSDPSPSSSPLFSARAALSRAAPSDSSFSSFSFRFAGEYLGFILRPCIKELQFVKQIRKWRERSSSLIGAGRASSLTIPPYWSRTLTLLSHVTQLIPFPTSFKTSELAVLDGLLHFPPQNVPYHALLSIDLVGITNLPLSVLHPSSVSASVLLFQPRL